MIDTPILGLLLVFNGLSCWATYLIGQKMGYRDGRIAGRAARKALSA